MGSLLSTKQLACWKKQSEVASLIGKVKTPHQYLDVITKKSQEKFGYVDSATGLAILMNGWAANGQPRQASRIRIPRHQAESSNVKIQDIPEHLLQ